VIVIANDCTGTGRKGNYKFHALNKAGKPFREGAIKDFPRQELLAYDLVFRVLREMVGERNVEASKGNEYPQGEGRNEEERRNQQS
jgi:hypothetical protein